MKQLRRGILAGFLLALTSALAATNAAAQSPSSWPDKSIRFIVPFAPGGSADVYGRILAQELRDSLGQSIVIENRPGAGSALGTEAAAKSPADGYTFLIMSNAHTVNETLLANLPYRLQRDFVAVTPINASDLLLVAHAKTGAGSLGEIIGMARAKPGSLDYASSGPGTPYHMAGELFKAMAGIDILHVPYKGSSGARGDLLGGHVMMMFDAITTMMPNVRAGTLKAIATTGRTRSPITPDVPTMNEAGVPGYEATIWLGLMAPTGTPAAIVERMNREVRAVMAKPQIRDQWRQQGAEILDMDPGQFAAYVDADIRRWADVVKKANIKPE